MTKNPAALITLLRERHWWASTGASLHALRDAWRNRYPPKKVPGSETTETTEAKHTPLACPLCGSRLVLRDVKKGHNAGRKYYGCAAFPDCGYTQTPFV